MKIRAVSSRINKPRIMIQDYSKKVEMEQVDG